MKIFLVEKVPDGYTLVEFSTDRKAVGEDEAKLAGSGHGLRLLIGIPDETGGWTHRKQLLAARRAVVAARKEKLAKIAVSLAPLPRRQAGFTSLSPDVLATQLVIANFEFVEYRTPPKGGWNFVDEVALVGTASEGDIERGRVIGEEMNHARRLSNIPGGDMTPEHLAQEAKKAGARCKFKVKILDEKKIRQSGMGGVLGVAKGSDVPPRFIVMEHRKGSKGEKPVVLVGKGVTFDTGGLNLKPTEHIYEMHMDMSGGAAVIAVMSALARAGVKKNVIGLVPAVENMPSGSSYRPGDVLRTMHGKTIEVTNTDAEGRVILADALEYAKQYDPALVVDVATLTGAAMSALGQRATALFSTDAALSRALQDLGEETGDLVWPLPLWEEYEQDIRGTFGDWANSSKVRYGGAITGAVFLWQFIKDAKCPWVHLDIAPRMTSVEGDFLAKGAAGAAIALLAQFLLSR